MQKSDHRSLVYELIGTQERYLVKQGKRAIQGSSCFERNSIAFSVIYM